MSGVPWLYIVIGEDISKATICPGTVGVPYTMAAVGVTGKDHSWRGYENVALVVNHGRGFQSGRVGYDVPFGFAERKRSLGDCDALA